MAGIGFTLRKLVRQDDLAGVFIGYVHSALASTGPWLFTILSLASISLFAAGLPEEELTGFRLIIIYNFAFSLALSGPVVMVATRYLSDLIFERDVREGAGILLGGLLLLYVSEIAVAGPFYFLYVKADLSVRLAGFVNFFLITGIWLGSLFLSALKDYGSISRSFAFGMLLAFVAAVVGGHVGGAAGMVWGFSAGLTWILFTLTARMFAEYPPGPYRPLALLSRFPIYWQLALSGLVYNLAIWIDKWILWFSPESKVLAYGLVSYPDYDGAMFLAYLTILPSLAHFLFNIETTFYEHYLRFYRDIPGKANYEEIERNQQRLIDATLGGARGFFIVQGGITLTCLLLAPKLFEYFNISFLQLGIFRFGVLGALFHALFLFLTIFLSYFDLRRENLYLQIFFLAANGLLSLVTLRLGFPYYGVGYMLAALASFVAAFFVTVRRMRELPYLTFVRGHENQA